MDGLTPSKTVNRGTAKTLLRILRPVGDTPFVEPLAFLMFSVRRALWIILRISKDAPESAPDGSF